MTDQPPPGQKILVLSRRKPHLMLILLLSILSGISIFVSEPVPGLPSWLQQAWATSCMLSGIGALIAHLQKWDRERGMYAERGMLIIQSAAVITYALSLPSLLGWTSDVVIALITAALWSGANLWEVKLISDDIGMLSTARKLKRRVTRAGDN